MGQVLQRTAAHNASQQVDRHTRGFRDILRTERTMSAGLRPLRPCPERGRTPAQALHAPFIRGRPPDRRLLASVARPNTTPPPGPPPPPRRAQTAPPPPPPL